MRIRVVVGDDHPAYREGIVSAIERAEDLECVGQCASAHATRELIAQAQPHVALLDLRMPPGDTQDLIREYAPATMRMIVLSAFTDGALVQDALEAGAHGYLAKESPTEFICEAIRSVHAGQTVMSENAQAALLAEMRSRAASRASLLSPREMEILKLMAIGRSRSDIAASLFIAPSTVKTHAAHIFEKLGVRTQASAVAEAMRRGLLS